MLKGNVKTSFLYIVFEALSRGGNTLIFFIGASILTKQEYLNLLSLFSLETLILNFCPFYYNEIYYKLIDIFEKQKLIFNIFYYTIIYTTLLLLIYLLFFNFINNYLESNFLIVFSIILSSFIRIIYQNKSTFYQIDEHHKSAIKNKALPFFISFVGGLIGFFIFEDRITYFFVGRVVGLLLLLLFEKEFFPKRKILISKFNLDWNIFSNIIKRSLLMIVKGITAWALGYGLIGILKNHYSEDTVFSVGLILNLWTFLLLISNGINSVYIPRFRKIYIEKGNFNQLAYSTLIKYFSITLILVIFYSIFYIPSIKLILNQYPKLNQYYAVFHFIILIFIAQIFQFVSTPYFYIYDKYNFQSIITIITSLISLILIYFSKIFYLYLKIDILSIIIIGYFIRSIPLYLISRLISNKK